MKPFPRMYAERTLTRMYRKLNWNDAQLGRYRQIFDAAANLYGIITLRDLLALLHRMGETVTEEDFLAFAEIMRHEEHCYHILAEDEIYTDGRPVEPIDRELIHESLAEFGFEGYDEVLAAQQGKPLYMPDLKTFLKYADEDYYEETSATKALRQFFQTALHRSRKDAEELLLETILVIRCEYRNPMQAAFDDFARMQIPMTFREAQQLGKLLMDLNNTTRNPYNRGFTPEELHQREGNRKPKSISFGSNLTAQFSDGTLDAREWMQKVMQDDTLSDDMRGMLLAELMKQQGSISDKTPAPSRNGLCPCGSGKKYKRCCGKK